MKISEILKELDLGNSVAEFDEDLRNYFVETNPFRLLIKGDADVIAGDKGTGKTAIFKVLQDRYTSLPELVNVEVITGFNPSGNPVFQRLAQGNLLTERQYTTVWKAYLLSLIGNWLLELYDDAYTEKMFELHELLSKTNLRTNDDTPNTVFSKICNSLSHFLQPSSAEIAFTFSETGIPIIIPKINYNGSENQSPPQDIIPHEEALGLLNTALEEADITVWVALDRLDEAFQGFPETEGPALRALFRSYLDLLEFSSIKLKIFVRRDLFRKITQEGFVNLTHVNARKVEIIWDEEDLKNLLCRRIKESTSFIEKLSLEGASDDDIFKLVFPKQVDPGARKPTTWNWIMSRIRDGNHIKPPRNLIDISSKAREAQFRRELREPREYNVTMPLIESDAIRRGLKHLSDDRVKDTLLAEAPRNLANLIELFRGSNAEHNDESLSKLFKIDRSKVSREVKPLIEIGFLERVGQSYKVPILYREGLGITQGKAF